MGQMQTAQPAISLLPIEIDPNKKYLIQIKVADDQSVHRLSIEDVVNDMCSALIVLGCNPDNIRIIVTPAGVDISAEEQ